MQGTKLFWNVDCEWCNFVMSLTHVHIDAVCIAADIRGKL